MTTYEKIQVRLGPSDNPFRVLKNSILLRASFLPRFFLVEDLDTGTFLLVHDSQISRPKPKAVE